MGVRGVSFRLMVGVLAWGAASLGWAMDSAQMVAEGYKRYGVESAIIEYEQFGQQSGTETVKFDRWGLRETRHEKTVVNMMGMSLPSEQLAIMDGDTSYIVDVEKSTALKVRNDMFEDMGEYGDTKDLVEVGRQMFERMGGRQIGTETIAGKPCDVWELPQMGAKQWVWKGITLKLEMAMGGVTMGTVATSIEEGVKISDEIFQLPAGVEVTDIEELDVEAEARRMHEE